jgi:hypothetical protein
MDNDAPTTNLNVTDIPLQHLEAIQRQADRRGWSRLQMIRHILAQAAAKELRKANAAAAEVNAKQAA